MKHFSGDVGQSVSTTVVEVRQLLVVNARQMQHRGMQVMHGDAIRDSAEADFIEFTKTINGVGDPAGVAVFTFCISAWLALCQPVTNSATRVFEAGADAYSMQTANEPDGMATALLKSVEYRDPTPAPWAEVLFYSHPSIERRIRAAMTWKAAHLPPELSQVPATSAAP